MAAFGDAVYFFAHRPGHNAEIWRSDGTRPGTRPLIELPAAADPVLNLQRIGGHWLFLSAPPGQPETFWTVDDGFTRAAPLTGCDGGCPDFAGSLTAPGPATWLFIGKDPFPGEEAWITDGTGPGTRRLVDACPGECSGIRPVDGLKDVFPVPYGKTYFRVYPREDAYYGAAGDELWVTDGTPAGTRRVARHFSEVGFAGSLALFGPLRLENPAYELWSTDGTRPRRIAVLRRFAQGSYPSFVPFQDGVLLLGDAGVGDYRLWRSDGTPEGTLPVRSFAQGRTLTYAFFLPSPGPSFQLFEVDHQKRNGGPIQTELWRRDGTPAGTHPAFPQTEVNDLTAFRGDLYFTASSPLETGGRGLFRVILPGGSPVLLARVNDSGAYLASPAQLTPIGDRLLFVGEDSEHGVELWATDGTAAGTQRLRDLRPGPGSSNPDGFTALGSRVFFTADGGTNGRELWESDGTPRGTRRLTDIAPGGFSAFPFDGYDFYDPPSFTLANGLLFFGADDGVTGIEPWVLPLEP